MIPRLSEVVLGILGFTVLLAAAPMLVLLWLAQTYLLPKGWEMPERYRPVLLAAVVVQWIGLWALLIWSLR